jgi:hypothetical protein
MIRPENIETWRGLRHYQRYLGRGLKAKGKPSQRGSSIMKQHITALALAAGAGMWLAAAPQAAHAGPIERACLGSARGPAPALCGCIQQVADATLTRRDQRAAARFFSDPGRAQEVRMSTRQSDNEFWSRYRQFGSVAEAQCARS